MKKNNLNKWLNFCSYSEFWIAVWYSICMSQSRIKFFTQCWNRMKLIRLCTTTLYLDSVTEPHHFYAAPAPGTNFDPAPAPTLLYSKAKFLKRTKIYIHVETILFIWFCLIYIAGNMNWMGYV
jgi:hypothetical protein